MSELTFLSALGHRFSDFLAFRRVGGIDSKSDRELLRYFDRFLAQEGFCGPWPTREVITEYLASIGHLNPRTQQNRLSLVRQFCRYLCQFEPQCFIPEDMLPRQPPRVRDAHIYSETEIQAILQAARQLPPPGSLRPKTYATLFGLLYTTGLRCGEAFALNLSDVNLADRVLFIQKGKFGKSRWVPISASTAGALEQYLEARSRAAPPAPQSPFFITRNAGRLYHTTVELAFRRVLQRCGLGRAWNEETHAYDWELGNNLSGEKQLWQKSTRDNALFLSIAVQLNSEQLQPIYDWFNNTLRMANLGGWTPGFSASLCEKSEKTQIMDFLHAADMDIEDILVKKKPFDTNVLPNDIPEQLKVVIASDLKDKQSLDIKTVHKGVDGKPLTFDLNEESDGTQKLFSFAGPWIDALANGYVLFIDELHDNLHPRLVQFLVQLFHNNETNPNNAQLVFTTHETSILNQEVFRRDQIWFCEKDEDQATALYPLTDFSPRKGRENLELAYLSGRYGALPYVRPLRKTG